MFAFYSVAPRLHALTLEERRGETSTPTWRKAAEGPRESFMIKELITLGIPAHRFH